MPCRVEYRVSFAAGFAYCSLSFAISGDPPWKVCQPYPERRHGIRGDRRRPPLFEEVPIKQLPPSVAIVHFWAELVRRVGVRQSLRIPSPNQKPNLNVRPGSPPHPPPN